MLTAPEFLDHKSVGLRAQQQTAKKNCQSLKDKNRLHVEACETAHVGVPEVLTSIWGFPKIRGTIFVAP